jgi:hypothetical protein
MPGVRVALRRAICVVATVASICVPALADAAPGDDGAEYRVKAAFLYNFARFVEWPAGGDGTMRVCLFPADSFSDVLERTVAGKTAHGLPFEIRRLERFDDSLGCDMVFFGAMGARRESALLGSLVSLPVLTVGDRSPFAARGGMINFVVDGGRVGFEINRKAADRAGLRISSKLLELARLVDEDDSDDGDTR